MRNILLFFLIASGTLCKAQISTGIFGQNAQLTKTVGTNTTINGRLDEYWDKDGSTYPASQNYIGESNVRYMRYGGNQVELDCNIDGNVGTGSALVSSSPATGTNSPELHQMLLIFGRISVFFHGITILLIMKVKLRETYPTPLGQM